MRARAGNQGIGKGKGKGQWPARGSSMRQGPGAWGKGQGHEAGARGMHLRPSSRASSTDS